MPEQLTSLASAKVWLGAAAGSQMDALLVGLINRMSAQVLGYLNRDSLVLRQYSDTFSGQGQCRQFTKNWPIVSVEAVVVGTLTMTPASLITPGLDPGVTSYSETANSYRFPTWDGIPPGGPGMVELIGNSFHRGHQNCLIQYHAGYGTQAESHVIPAGGALQVNQTYGTFNTDQAVTDNATPPAIFAFRANTAQADLLTGQYSLDLNTSGGYLFATADVGRTVLIDYSWVPYSVEQVVLEMIAESNRRRTSPGVVSHSLAGQESATYDKRGALPGWAAQALQSYSMVLPV
jgi:hypothetical protein